MPNKRTTTIVALAVALVLVFALAVVFVSKPGCTRKNQDSGVICRSELVEYSTLIMSQAVLTLRRQLDAYENLTFQFAVNPELNAILADYVQSSDANRPVVANRAFANYMESWTFGDQAVCDAFFVGPIDRARKALAMRDTLPPESLQAFAHSQVYDAIVSADGEPVWRTNVQVSFMGPSFVVLGRRIRHAKSGRPLGVLALLISPECLCRPIAEYLDSNYCFPRGTVRSNCLLIVDGKGRPISAVRACSDDLTAETCADWVAVCTSHLRRTLPTYAKCGHFGARLGNDDVLVMHSSIEDTDWHLFVPIQPRGRVCAAPLTCIMHDPWAVVAGAMAATMVQLAVIIVRRARRRRTEALLAEAAPDVCACADYGGNECLGKDAPASPANVKPAWLGMLTPREKAILFLLSQGCSNQEIAGRMCLAEQTIKNYLSVIYSKLGVRDRIHASLMASEVALSDEEMDLPET